MIFDEIVGFLSVFDRIMNDWKRRLLKPVTQVPVGMSYRVIFSPETEEQLVALYRYIADAASSHIAAGYTEAIVSYCESLCIFPHRGAVRDGV
jgi:hypothetical protein